MVAVFSNVDYLPKIHRIPNKILHFSFILLRIQDCASAYGAAIILAKGD
jgi:hypothetical protein